MMDRKIIHLIVAARPNFMKMAPLYHALKKEEWCTPLLIHTGQHFDANMSDAFFADLDLPAPDHHLGCGGGSHAHQTARVMMAYDDLLERAGDLSCPDLVVVAGDVNSTLACTLVASKRQICVAHLEAGLRSFDMSMPEEINRKMVDSVADILLTPSIDANEHLQNENIASDKIWYVGNIMMDSFEMLKDKIELAAQNSPSKPYVLVTMHRPANVDDKENLQTILTQIVDLSQQMSVIWPLHPRTRKQCELFGLMPMLKDAEHITLLDPLPYIDFMALVTKASLVLSDSGGVQEETTYLNIPCLTVRPNTERPITITQGTNKLIEVDEIWDQSQAFVCDRIKQGAYTVPDLWDGKTAARIVSHLKAFWAVSL